MKHHIRLLWTVTLFMVLFLARPHLLQASTNQTTYSQSVSVQSNDAKPEPKIFGLIVVLIAVAVVGYILWQIIKLAQKIPPPDPPPQQPTNSPPVVINPTSSPGPAGLGGVASAVMASYPNPILATNNPTSSEMGWYDIRYLGYSDSWAKVPSLFSAYWSTGMSLSTNLTNWEDSHYRIDAFISDTGTFFAYFHYDTNYYNCYFTESASARAYFDLTDQPMKAAQFFRLDPR